MLKRLKKVIEKSLRLAFLIPFLGVADSNEQIFADFPVWVA